MGDSANPRPRPWRFGSDNVNRQALAHSGLIIACLAPPVTPAMAWTCRKPRESAAQLVLACFPVFQAGRGMNSQLEDGTRGRYFQFCAIDSAIRQAGPLDSLPIQPARCSPPSSTFKQWHRVNSRPGSCRCHPTSLELPLQPSLPANPGYTATSTPQACRPSPPSGFPRSPTSRTWVAPSIPMSVQMRDADVACSNTTQKTPHSGQA